MHEGREEGSLLSINMTQVSVVLAPKIRTGPTLAVMSNALPSRGCSPLDGGGPRRT